MILQSIYYLISRDDKTVRLENTDHSVISLHINDWEALGSPKKAVVTIAPPASKRVGEK